MQMDNSAGWVFGDASLHAGWVRPTSLLVCSTHEIKHVLHMKQQTRKTTTATATSRRVCVPLGMGRGVAQGEEGGKRTISLKRCRSPLITLCLPQLPPLKVPATTSSLLGFHKNPPLEGPRSRARGWLRE